MFKILKRKKDDNCTSLSVQEIKVIDLKQYLVNGYNEIRQVKQKLEEKEEELEKEKLYKIKYDATLVTLDEFKNRDDENKEKIKKIEQKIIEKNEEIYELNSKLNSLIISERENKKKYDNQYVIVKQELLEKMKTKLENKKGNLSRKEFLKMLEE